MAGQAVDDLFRYKRLRESSQYAQDRAAQDIIGPLEHRDFVEELTRKNPVAGAAAYLASPAYTGVKKIAEITGPGSIADRIVTAVGGGGNAKRSSASWDEIFGAMQGFRRGLGLDDGD
jgi:hypothetical protein